MKTLLILLAYCLISCEGGYSSYTYQSVPTTTVHRTYTPVYTPVYYSAPRRVYCPPPVVRYQYRTPRLHSVETRSYKKKCP
jgi:hypothetical protein